VVYTYIHTYTHTCTYRLVDVSVTVGQVLPCVLGRSYTCIHAYMHTCIHAYMHTCIHAYMHTCIHACIHPQVGRCGRDGKTGYCHAFLNDPDFIRMRSLAHSHSVDLRSVQALLSAVYAARDGDGDGRSALASKREANKAVKGRRRKSGRVRLMESLCRRLDLYPETVETILSFLDGDKDLLLLNNEPAKGSVMFTEGQPDHYKTITAGMRSLAGVIQRGKLIREGYWSFDFEEVAIAAGMSVLDVHAELRRFEGKMAGK
jgi:hypothetical protein